jgi:ATP/maltotriose-dependent transcriptional regulator MalT
VEIGLLGPLEVRDDAGAPIDVGGARLRTLLILLALDPGRVVTSGRLVTGLMDQAARTADRVGARNEIGYVLHGRAEFARHDGDPERALMLCQRARAHMDEQQVAPQLLAIVASGIGLAQAACGDLHAARASHVEALVHAEASHDAPVLGRVLDGFADLALAEGDPTRAAELLAAATAVRGGPDAGQIGPARTAAAAHRALGDHRFAEATARGAATAYHNLTPASPTPLSLIKEV